MNCPECGTPYEVRIIIPQPVCDCAEKGKIAWDEAAMAQIRAWPQKKTGPPA